MFRVLCHYFSNSRMIIVYRESTQPWRMFILFQNVPAGKYTISAEVPVYNDRRVPHGSEQIRVLIPLKSCSAFANHPNHQLS